MLSTLLASQQHVIQKCEIAALVRREDQARILNDKGIKAELFRDLDASDEIERIASSYDSIVKAIPQSNGQRY